MSRITRYALARAVAKVRAMNETQKEQLADQLFRAQPHVVASLLVRKQLGVSLEKMDFLIEILLICFQAMNESGLTWPLIAEDEQSVKWDASSPQFTSVTTCSGVFAIAR
jgi:hypothetical protein